MRNRKWRCVVKYKLKRAKSDKYKMVTNEEVKFSNILRSFDAITENLSASIEELIAVTIMNGRHNVYT